MSTSEISLLMKAIAPVIKEYTLLELAPILARLEVLEANAQVEKLAKPRVRVAAGKGERK